MTGNWKKLEKYINEDNYLLVKGDISGIQDFIFNVQSKSAAKTLRGKSAYINFLTLVIVHRIFDEIKSTDESKSKEDGLIYLGGGNFYFIISKGQENNIKKIRLNILKELRNEFDGDIYLAMDWIDITSEDIQGNISKKWLEINEKVRKKGNRKWTEMINDGDEEFYEIFFNIGDVASETEICSVCKKSYTHNNPKGTRNVDEEKAICQNCKKFIALGESVRNAKSLNIEKLTDIKFNKNEFEILGYKLSFSEKKEVNSTYCFNEKNSDNNLYFPTHSPMMKNEFGEELPKDFDNLAESSTGAKKLGILKLDVDNLGGIFENKETLEKLMATSQKMKCFFEGKLNELVLKEEYKDYVYIIFSGGDDTFIVGSYDKILLFARELKKEFDKEFKKDGYSFSAGLLIADAKQSVKSFSIKVEEYLEKSKDRKDSKENKLKNAITIFGEVFSWNEYVKLLKMKENIKSIAEKESRAILNKIMDSTKGFLGTINAKRYDEKKKRVWRLAYYLRNCSNEKEKVEELIKIYEDLALNRENKEYTNASIIPVATRLAEFETRKEKK